MQARVESRIRCAKATGLRRMPSKSFKINSAWCVAVACDLLAWFALLGLDGELAKAEPKAVRYRLLHTAGRIVREQRRRRLRIPETWPWARELQTAFARSPPCLRRSDAAVPTTRKGAVRPVEPATPGATGGPSSYPDLETNIENRFGKIGTIFNFGANFRG